MFFGSIGKTRWPPWPLIGWDIFDFSSETAERNSKKLDRKQDLKALYEVCVFRADPKNKMAALTSDLLRHFRLLLWNRWTEFNETWQEARSHRPLPNLCFSGRSGKQDGRPCLWLAETFSTSPLKPLNGIQRNLTGCKISTSSTKFVFFGLIGKTRWPPWSLIGWYIFNFSSETSKQNSTKLDRKQDIIVLYQVCVFRADRENKMACLASDWLRHFRLLLWNRWTEFNETWQEARSYCPLQSLCFSGRSVNKNVRLGWFLKEVAHCTQVHDMWPFGPLVSLSSSSCLKLVKPDIVKDAWQTIINLDPEPCHIWHFDSFCMWVILVKLIEFVGLLRHTCYHRFLSLCYVRSIAAHTDIAIIIALGTLNSTCNCPKILVIFKVIDLYGKVQGFID